MRLILLLTFITVTISAQRVVIVNEDTGEKTFTKFPSLTDTVVGLQSNLKLYYVLEKPWPTYDRLTEKLVSVKTFTDSVGEGKKYPFYVYDYRVERLPDTVIQARKELAVLQKENELLMNSLDDATFKQYITIGLGLLIYERAGNTLTVKQEAILSKMLPFCIKAYQNYIVKDQLIQDIKINVNTDINQNWTE